MQIILNISSEVAIAESDAIQRAIRKCASFSDNPDFVCGIRANPRDSKGWLEFHLVMKSDAQGNFVRGQSMVIGMIQRSQNEGFEFHS